MDMNLGDIIQPSISGVIQISNMSPPCHLFWAALVLECGSPAQLLSTDLASVSFTSACLLSQPEVRSGQLAWFWPGMRLRKLLGALFLWYGFNFLGHLFFHL